MDGPGADGVIKVTEQMAQKAMELERRESERMSAPHLESDELKDQVHSMVLFIVTHLVSKKKRPSKKQCKKKYHRMSIKYPALFKMIYKSPESFKEGRENYANLEYFLEKKREIESGRSQQEVEAELSMKMKEKYEKK